MKVFKTVQINKVKKFITDKCKKMTKSEWILFTVLIAVLLVMFRYIFTAGNTVLHSDSASVILLADEMRRKGQLFPDGWYHGTAISLLPFPACLFLMLGADYIFARNLAQALFAILMLVSVILFSRKYLQNNSWLLIALFLFSFLSSIQYSQFFVEAAYSSQIFIMFFSLVCFSTSIEMDPVPRLRRRRIPVFLFYTVCISVIGSIFFQQVILPLCAALFFLCIMDIRPYSRNSTECSSKINHYKWIFLTILSAALIGVILYRMLCSHIHLEGNSALVTFEASVENYVQNLSLIFQALLLNAGIRGNVSLFSLAGIQNVLGLFFAVAAWIVFPIMALKDFKNETRRNQILLIFTVVHIAEVFILLLFCFSPILAKARYMLSSLTLLSTISGDYIYKHYVKGTGPFKVFSSILISAVLCTMTLSVPTTSYSPQTLQNMRGLTDFLKENGLEYGYASYWNSHRNSVLSNGEVLIRPVKIGSKAVSKMPILSSEDWYDPEYFEGKTFILLTDDEAAYFAPDGYENTNLWIPETTLNYPPYTILVYDHNISRNDFNGMLSGKANLLRNAACSDGTMRQANGEILINTGQTMYGPYIPLGEGKYNLTVDALLSSPVDITVSAADAGGEVFGIYELNPGTNEFQFTLNEPHSQVEFVVRNPTEQTIRITGVYLLKDDGAAHEK